MTQQPRTGSQRDRVVALLFGVFFFALGAAVFVLSEPGTRMGSAIAGTALCALGLEALIAAARNRPSLLSRIGPLP